MCAHAVRVAVEKIPGVDSARVSLNEGYADIHLAPENTVTVERIRETIRNNGFTPKETRIRVTGVVTKREEEPALEVGVREVTFLLVAHPDAETRVVELARTSPDREVTVEGVVPETAQGAKGPLALEVLRFAVSGRTPP